MAIKRSVSEAERIAIRQLEAAEKKQRLEEAFSKAVQAIQAGSWEELLQIGLKNPALMNRLCSIAYPEMPDEYRYSLPVQWFFSGGCAATSVCLALKKALYYRPSEWIGQESLSKPAGIDVYIGIRGTAEDAKSQFAWTTTKQTAYIDAHMKGGSVFQAFLPADKIIALNAQKTSNVLQYKGVLGVHRIFPAEV